MLWPLFGTVNQLLAALALLVVSVYLFRRRANPILTLASMVFVLFMTGWAMVANLRAFAASRTGSF